jgi:hypothetical protein
MRLYLNRASPSEEQIREDLAHARKVEATRVVGEKFAKLKSHYEVKYGSSKPATRQSRAQLGHSKAIL